MNKIPENGSRWAKDIAKELGLDENYFYRIMRAASAMELFREDEEQEGVFWHSPMSKLLIEKDGWVNVMKFKSDPISMKIWENLEDTIREGKSKGAKSLGLESLWEYLNMNKQYKYLFDHAMSSYTKYTNKWMLDITDFSKFKTIVDLGGNRGDLLFSILKATPTIQKGINLDLKYVIESNKLEDRSYVDRSVMSRYSEVAGSFLEAVPTSDCYIAKLVFHNWDDEHCKKILDLVSKSIQPGGNIIIIDRVIITKNKFHHSVFSDIDMMHQIGGKERTIKEWEHLAQISGYKIDSLKMLADDIHGRIILSKK
eukprot:gene11682-14303_t